MARPYVFEDLGSYDALERKLSMSAISVRHVPVDDDLPPPRPEDDPGPDSGSDGPIVYPTLPPTGPEGPG